MDAKDILGFPKTPLPLPQEKNSRPQKDSQRKPDGISWEGGGMSGLRAYMPSIDAAQLKRRSQPVNEKITWQWLPFTNSAQEDNLQLYHWVRVANGVPPTGDYSFAKYNKSDDIVKYTGEEYEKYLTDPEPYNVAQEIECKRALSVVLSQTKQQERKDAEVIAEAKRISESRMIARGAEESELPVTSNAGPEGTERAIVPVDTVSPSSNVQFASATIAPPTSMTENGSDSLRMLQVYTRTFALNQMVQTANSYADFGLSSRLSKLYKILGCNIRRQKVHLIMTVHMLETPSTPKRLQRGVDQDRTFIPDSISFGGGRVGKRDQKRKAPGRFSEAPSSPAQSKRPQKLKASDE